MSAHSLRVLDSTAPVGTVDYETFDERFAFRYAPEWLRDARAFSISPHITMLGPDAGSGTVRRYLENLLPERKALEILALSGRMARTDLFGLIRAYGQESTGALSFVAPGPKQIAATGREISEGELAERIQGRTHHPFVLWDGHVHALVAGAQDKLPVHRDDNGRLYLPGRVLPSTHILKPEPADKRLPQLVANEHFCMSLARRLELPAASVSLLRVPDPVLLVERFDRVAGERAVHRVHVIDGCQALNLPVSDKYEHPVSGGRDTTTREGVSFERLFSAADYTKDPNLTRLVLLRWALLQYLIGNTDAHAKNISFFCDPSGLSPAPHYDLTSLAQYPEMRQELAMAIGDEFSLSAIRAYDWAEFAARTGTPRRLLVREMRRLANAAPVAAGQQSKDPAYTGDERASIARVTAFVQEQAHKLQEMSELVLKADLE